MTLTEKSIRNAKIIKLHSKGLSKCIKRGDKGILLDSLAKEFNLDRNQIRNIIAGRNNKKSKD